MRWGSQAHPNLRALFGGDVADPIVLCLTLCHLPGLRLYYRMTQFRLQTLMMLLSHESPAR